MRTHRWLYLTGLVLGLQISFGQTFVPAGGNMWITRGPGRIAPEGIVEGDESTVSTGYVRVAPGELSVALVLKGGTASGVRVTVNGLERVVSLGSAGPEHYAGTWSIEYEGYVPITVAGLRNGILEGFMLKGSAVTPSTAYVKDNEGSFFYWGRRGPSVHLRYDLSDRQEPEYFYSEVKVPEGNDVVGSYYMANGFADGYFGFQVNGESERRILFSVWSPFRTDDPKSIPPEDRVILVKKGEGVYTGEFGNEGSGGQSYLRFPWNAGTTYGFLLRAQPEGTSTAYTAWFYAPEAGRWKLIAGWRRPKKSVYLSSLYSFLENFIPETGNQERRAYFGNAWVRDIHGRWTELTRATFTGDNTARKSYRKDYGGGVNGNAFYLRNCGFFSDFTPLDQLFVRPSGGKPPVIDFSVLE